MPTCWGRVSFYLPPFLQISKGVDCFPGVVTVQGLWAQGAGAVFTREAGASLGAGLSHPPCLLPSFAPFSNAACFLSPSEERRGEDDDAERGWTLSRNEWPSPGLPWVAEVCFCTAAGVWWHVVPHRLEMGPPCHLRPPPNQSQMPPPDSEPPGCPRHQISTRLLFTGELQKPPIWIEKNCRVGFPTRPEEGFPGRGRGTPWGGVLSPGRLTRRGRECAWPAVGSTASGQLLKGGGSQTVGPGPAASTFLGSLSGMSVPRATSDLQTQTSGAGPAFNKPAGD